MSTMRIGGLASGIDTDSIVEKLMQAERAPLDKLEQQKQTYEWQRDAYRDVNTKLNTLDTYIADNFILKSLNTKTVTSSNSSYVTATATSSASGTLSLEEVSQLATAARGVGSKVNATGTTTLADLFENSNVNVTNSSLEIRAIQADGTLAEKATKIEFTTDMTVNQLVSKINSSTAGVNAVFENGQLSITAKNTGDVKDEKEIIVEAGQDVFSAFGFVDVSNLVTEEGKNSIFQVNGINTERSTNTFSISGYSVTLKDTFNTAQAVNLTATTDIDDMVSKIKEFVTTYNGLITDLTNLTNEAKYRDYKPLTTAQRDELEEKQIDLWEEKAKSGLLRGDSIIREGLSSMRSLIYESNPAVANPKFNTLYNIGITTSKDYLSGGTLEIDEDKLRAALEEDPDAVATLFRNTAGKDKDNVLVDGVEKEADTRGFMQKLRASINTIELKIEGRAGRASMVETQYTLGKYLKDVDSSIKTWQDKLVTIEDRYWKQFSTMESMINKANNQSSMLMGISSY